MSNAFWGAVIVVAACIAVAVPITIIYLAWEDTQRINHDKK
jgi:hypothetical protein